MAWEDDLFAVLDDLEGQAAAAWEADREAEVADRARTEYASVTLASRLMASRGYQVAVDLPCVGRLGGTLARVGQGWCLLVDRGQDWIVPLLSVTAVHGASDRSVPEVAWSPVDRMSLRTALRRVADAGSRCVLHVADGARHEAYVERVGADFLEARTVAGAVVLVPYAGLVAVQSPDG